MQDIIALKIDVTKIEKDRLFPGKNGAKYLDMLLIPSPDNKYGNSHMAVQSVSKEEREAGKRGPILGNAKPIGGQARPAKHTTRRDDIPEDDIPF